MGWIWQVVLALIVLGIFLDRWRRDRALGGHTNWPKAIVSAISFIVVIVAATFIGALISKDASPAIGVAVSLLLICAGVAIVVMIVNRCWPAAPAVR